MKDFRYLYYLTKVEGLGSVRIKRLLERFESAENVFSAGAAELSETENISIKLADAILQSQVNFLDLTIDYDTLLKKLDSLDAGVMVYEDEDYPYLLKRTYDPPVILYTRGNIDESSFDNCIAIVGTRRPSDYGKKIAEDFASELSGMGFNIISGFARGVDTSAHKAVLDSSSSQGRTTAVLGCGIDIIYPPENKKLYERMCKEGILLSEYDISAIPDAVNFPKRNRIISGLSYGSVIIESTATGGAMITARFALDQSREVFAVPGFVTSKNSEGPNSLIKSGQAKLVENVTDILDEIKNELRGISINGQGKVTKAELPELNENEKIIYNLIASEKDAIHIDNISENSGLNISDCLVTLLNLEFKGLMEQLPGKRFKVSSS
jgi:DNA processing protein